jgi:hypothetical protein
MLTLLSTYTKYLNFQYTYTYLSAGEIDLFYDIFWNHNCAYHLAHLSTYETKKHMIYILKD